ncbi:MAG TPA: cbb3-type cytochrome c oxidase subunit I [Acidimicrobiales bacterium]|nr:cbb3-type cytochrome c oxidase subunit I [Acidimicrobiales bacterium]
MLNERLGKASFWLMFVGAWVTLLPMYLLGLHGMPRRIAEYAFGTGWTGLNRTSTMGSYLFGLSVAVFAVNIYVSWRRPVPAAANPWDGHTLEWATSSPPPPHNFVSIPVIRSERPVWDANHPEHRAIDAHAARVDKAERRRSGAGTAERR